MKRLVAEFLRYRTPWQLLAIAAVCTVAGILIIYNVYSSTLKLLKTPLIVLFGVGGAALFMAVFRRAEQIGATGGAGRMWGRFVAAVLAVAGLIAFATYSFGHHGWRMRGACNGALLPETFAERRAALEQAEAGLRSPFALLPRLVDDVAGRECARTRSDLDRVERGLCTEFTLVDRPCTCGAETYPYARCEEPRCVYEPGLPDRFDCPGDPIPEGYSNF